MRFLLICILLLSFTSCKKSDFTHSNTQTPLQTPILYARYETLPTLLRTKPGPCAQAETFKAPDRYRLNALMDLCGPIPQKTEIPQKNPWLLPNGVKSFHWEQTVQNGEKIQLELLGSEGSPLPSEASVSKIGTRFLIELKPTEKLESGTVLAISATLLDASGRKISSWSVPFKVSA